MEEKRCLGKDCPDKRCEICEVRFTTQLDVTDNFRSSKHFPNGYYSGGGLAHVYDPKTGRTKIIYARRSGD